MFHNIKRKYKNHLDEVLSTIKLIDIEERFDIYFSRFCGLYFAKISKRLGLMPTHVSLISLVIGLVGGSLLYYQNHFNLIIIASVLIIWAGILDSTDGQLARITKQSSEVGRVIDGLIDNLVFISCYIGGTFYLVPQYGWWVFLLAFVAGYAHSYKSALYEFYKSEYLFLIGKSPAGNIPISMDKIKRIGHSGYHNILDKINQNYTKKQLKYTTRNLEDRLKMRELSVSHPKKFDPIYTKLNLSLLFWWAWLGGSNVHRNTIIIFSLFGRFDLYLICSLTWTLGCLILNRIQQKNDIKLFKEFSC